MDNKYGYNAKPGGCGGWIVPPEKYDKWKKKLSKRNTGKNNSNAINLSNKELLKIATEICLKFPKSFTLYRFDGKYRNFVSILKKRLCMNYNPYYKSEDQINLFKKLCCKGKK